MDLDIGGRVAIVTGASKGIGRAVASALAAEGVSVLLSARNPEPLDQAVAELRSSGADVAACPADVAVSGFSRPLLAECMRRWGRVDIAVNNAGGGPQAGDNVSDFDAATWAAVFHLNVISAMELTLACVPDMRTRGWGRVVNVSSTAGRVPDARFASYGAAKAALLHATRTTALAHARDGILVNAVLPGLVRSDGVLAGYADAAAASDRTAEDIEARMMDRQPIAMGRTGEPDEVAGTIAFLCSERASWMTGALVLVDGGTVKALP